MIRHALIGGLVALSSIATAATPLEDVIEHLRGAADALEEHLNLEPATVPDAEPLEPVESEPEPVESEPEPVEGPQEAVEPEVDVAPLTIDPDSIRIEDISGFGAKVWFTASEKVMAYIEYGTTTEYGRETSREESFRYAIHRQTIDGAPSGSTIHFRIHVESESGEKAVSDDFTFVTDDRTAKSAIKGWPSNDSEDRPYAGLFYGADTMGTRTSNSKTAAQNSRRFRVERTGFVVAARHDNRTLKPGTAADRCRRGHQPQYCNCVKAKVSDQICSYTLGNSYSVGNGGRIHVELRESLPSGDPDMSDDGLRGVTNSYVPVDIHDIEWPTLKFKDPAPVTEGESLHLVYRNAKPPTACGYSGESIHRAKTVCRHDEGAIGLNGWEVPPQGKSTAGKYGPFERNASAVLYSFGHRGDPTKWDWKVDGDNLSWYELVYEDGVEVGTTGNAYNTIYNSLGGDRSSPRKHVGGSKRARQRLVAEYDFETDGVWVLHGAYGGRHSGKMTVELKDGSGRVLAKGAVPANSECNQLSKSSNTITKECTAWGYTDLDRTVELEKGERYYVELSGGSGFTTAARFWMNYGKKVPSRNRRMLGDGCSAGGSPGQSYAEYSSDGGKSWRLWVGRYYACRDLSFMLVRAGSPRTML